MDQMRIMGKNNEKDGKSHLNLAVKDFRANDNWIIKVLEGLPNLLRVFREGLV